MTDADPILSVQDLVTTFHTGDGPVNAVRGVSFDLRAGETMALVGESGSGKSVTALSVLNMVRHPGRIEGGKVLFRGRDLLALDEGELRTIRGKSISLIFQDPIGSLDPLMKVRDQITEAIQAHRRVSGDQATQRAVELMTPGRDSGSRSQARRLSARVLGRHVPARHDRDGARQRARRDHRG